MIAADAAGRQYRHLPGGLINEIRIPVTAVQLHFQKFAMGDGGNDIIRYQQNIGPHGFAHSGKLMQDLIQIAGPAVWLIFDFHFRSERTAEFFRIEAAVPLEHLPDLRGYRETAENDRRTAESPLAALLVHVIQINSA